ncbi:MAG: hypothetical protein GVY25_06925 [Bacteroidetes bacterium]|jgi:hypothetical protein|nr:hypothetical protein [Bacteroidota bacterium]
MPRLDIALHPIALAFGLLAVVCIVASIAAVIYATPQSNGDSATSSDAEAREIRPFVPKRHRSPQHRADAGDDEPPRSRHARGTN